MTNPNPLIPKPGQELSDREVAAIHRNDDFNSRPESHHHSLGTSRTEASPGNHVHDGITSLALLDSVVFTGSRSSNTVTILAQVLTALTILGATDSTTA